MAVEYAKHKDANSLKLKEEENLKHQGIIDHRRPTLGARIDSNKTNDSIKHRNTMTYEGQRFNKANWS